MVLEPEAIAHAFDFWFFTHAYIIILSWYFEVLFYNSSSTEVSKMKFKTARICFVLVLGSVITITTNAQRGLTRTRTQMNIDQEESLVNFYDLLI